MRVSIEPRRTRRTASALLCVLRVLHGSGRAEAQPAPVAEFAFEVRGQRAFVPVTIDGRGPYWFVLDTGAGGYSIDEGLARTLGITAAPAGVTRGAGAGAMRVGRSGPATLVVGGVPVRVAALTVSPLDALLRPSSGRAAPGIVGRDFFAGRVVEIDAARRRIRVWPAGTDLARAGDVVVPIRVDGVPHAAAVVTDAAGRADTLDVIVDLGAKLALHVTEPAAARLRLADRLGSTVYMPLGAGVGGETRYHMARLPALRLGAASAPDAPGATTHGTIAGLSADGTLRSTAYDALLGFGYLARFRLVFDDPARRLVLTPTAAADRREPFDRAGLFAVADGEVLRVRYVVPRAPADAAGIVAGDTLAALDGRPLAAGDLDLLREALADDGRTVVALRVRRGAAARDVRVALGTLLP